MDIIIMPPGGVKKLAKDFKISRQTIHKALRGISDSDKARMLRKAALERGGRQFSETLKQ